MPFIPTHLFNGLCIALAVGLFAYANACGLGQTYDSKLYLQAGAFWAGQSAALPGFERPPLQGCLLALGAWLGMERWAYGVNLLALVISVVFFGHCAKLVVQPLCLRQALMLAWAVATPLHLAHRFIWSEPVFLAFWMLHTWLLLRWVGQPRRYDWWGLLLCATAMNLQRTAGLFWVIGTAVVLLWRKREVSKAQRWSEALGYVAGALLPWVVWTAWGWQAGSASLQTMAGEAWQQSWAEKQNVRVYFDELSRWFLPALVAFRWRVAVFCIALAMGLRWAARQPWSATQRLHLTSLLIPLLVYLLMMQGITQVPFEEAQRYLALAYPAVLLLLGCTLAPVFAYRAVSVGLGFWVVYGLLRTLQNVYFWHNVGCF